MSVELLDELKETAAPDFAALGSDKRAEIDETIGMLTGNLEKIAEHGRRADGIVRSMLEHSRGTSGERRIVDLKGLIKEALNLAYRGARPGCGLQYHAGTRSRPRRRADRAGAAGDHPRPPEPVRQRLLHRHQARPRQRRGRLSPDPPGVNPRSGRRGRGPGARQRHRHTQPTGEGTGLGLSISYDIVTQQHGGAIEVDSEPGEIHRIHNPPAAQRSDTGRSA